MVNQYARGARVENIIADELRERGYDIIRSAGSKGGADLVALHDLEIALIQVKVGASALPKPAERERLLRMARRVPGTVPVVAYRTPMPGNARERVIVWRELTGAGPRDWRVWLPRDSRKEAAGEVAFS